MAPAASTLLSISTAVSGLGGARLPEDVLLDIASYVSPDSLNALLRTCKRFYGIVVPLLYHTIYLDIRPIGYVVDGDYPRAFRLLACLLSTLPHYTTQMHSPRFLPQFVRTISYRCDYMEENLRGLPMLAILLRFTPYLRHLQIDIDPDSVPLGLDLLHRRGIIRSPPSTAIDVIDMPSATSLTLPHLQSVRSTWSKILAALLQWRPVQTAVLDWATSLEDLAVLFPFTLSTTPNHMTRLALSLVAEEEDFDPILRAIALTFPELEHLAIRCATRASAILLPFLALEPVSLHKLRTLSVNHVSTRGNYAQLMESVFGNIHIVGAIRPHFRQLICGKVMAARVNEFSMEWMLDRCIDTRAWRWINHARSDNQSILALFSRVLEPLMSYGRSPITSALYVVEIVSHRCLFSLMATAELLNFPTPFERFLLSAPDDVVDRFFSGWSADLILCLRCLNSSIFMGVEAYCARAWSIERSFDRWFFNVANFLEILEASGGIVSGSEAQQHLARHEFRGTDLDIYLPYHGLLGMGRWLKQQGFLYQPSAGKHILFDAAAIMYASAASMEVRARGKTGSNGSHPYSTFNFIRPEKDAFKLLGMDGALVQLIVVRGNPVDFLVENFHSTGVMNYINSKCAVSLFPRSTFVDRYSFVCQDTSQNAFLHEAWMAKYRRRGFSVIGSTDGLPSSVEIRQWSRTIGDHLTWIMPHVRSYPSKKTERLIPNGSQFEVLTLASGVVARGASLRVGPKFLYR
ncbi:hypothetical protein C2E23DRAFT_739592 [Lenzites betulinus]|nr:hypothetical protein C2E23DRAFT_739592 [Lenzites betulinus]